MLDENLLTFLRCPDNRSSLHTADDNLLVRVNDAIRSSKLRNQGGEVLSKPISGGLVREAGDLMYPVVDQIPVMLHDEAILLEQLNSHG